MRRLLLCAGLLFLLTARPAVATDIHLAWDDCGAAGQEKKFFGCETNVGPAYTIVGSFIPPEGITAFVGLQARVWALASSDSLPDWWKHGIGQCRSNTGLTATFDFTTGPFTCQDFFAGQALGTLSYTVGFSGPNTARLDVAAAVDLDHAGPLDPTLEYYAFQLRFLRSRTVGPDACAGCSIPVCVFIETMQLFQTPAVNNDPIIYNAFGPAAIWQNASFANYTEVGPVCMALDPVPTARATWGRIKTLFR